jgi:hypothetical protein
VYGRVWRLIQVSILADAGEIVQQALSWLFARPELPRKWWQVIVWWELRRIPYNVIVGGAGCLTLAAMVLAGGLYNLDAFPEPFGFILVGLAINFFYAAGWLLELMLLALTGKDRAASLLLYKLGVAFSVCVILIPGVLFLAYPLIGRLWHGK